MEQQFIEDNLILLSKQTIDLFFSSDKPSDNISLYTLYYYTAKWQKTNSIKCTTSYASKALKWSKARTITAKKFLIEKGLIEDVKRKSKEGKITGWYIKINYVWKKEKVEAVITENHPHENAQGGLVHPVESLHTNALSDNNLNALSGSNINALQTKVCGEENNHFQEPLKEIKPLEKIEEPNNYGREVNELMKLFQPINPAVPYWNKTQREATKWLIENQGFELTKQLIIYAVATNGKKYAPVITTPLMLKTKLGQLITFHKKEISNRPLMI